MPTGSELGVQLGGIGSVSASAGTALAPSTSPERGGALGGVAAGVGRADAAVMKRSAPASPGQRGARTGDHCREVTPTMTARGPLSFAAGRMQSINA